MIGERNHGYTTDFVLDQNLGKTRRGTTLEIPKMSSRDERISERWTLPVPGALVLAVPLWSDYRRRPLLDLGPNSCHSAIRRASRVLAIEASSRGSYPSEGKARGSQKSGSCILGWIDGDICQTAPTAHCFEKGILVGSVFKASKNRRTALYMTGWPD